MRLIPLAFLLAFPLGARAADPPRPDPPPVIEAATEASTVIVQPGDTLTDILIEAGFSRASAHAAALALAPHLPPRSLRPGQEITLVAAADDDAQLAALDIEPRPGRRITLTTTETGGYAVAVEEAPRIRHLVRAEATITASLYEDMRRAGLPPGLIMDLIRTLAHTVDFQRDIRPGDRFAVMFERYRDDEGALLAEGHALHAELLLAGKRMRIWRHTSPDGAEEWFDERGHAIRRTLLRTPLDAARVSSRFGMRRHPILGYSRMHQGIDFAAPSGTPVYAAGDGHVLFAGTKGGYGTTLQIRHRDGTVTLYGHLSSIARGLRAGGTVRQGQVVARVGSTGMSTGPHLHYEVHRANRAVDPASVGALAGRALDGRDLTAYRSVQARMSRQFAALSSATELAAGE